MAIISTFMTYFHLGAAVIMAYFAISSYSSVRWWRAKWEEVSSFDAPTPDFVVRQYDLLVDCEAGIERNWRMVWFSLTFGSLNLVGAYFHYF